MENNIRLPTPKQKKSVTKITPRPLRAHVCGRCSFSSGLHQGKHMQRTAATASSSQAKTGLLKRGSEPFHTRTDLLVFLSSLLLCLVTTFAHGESLDANGIRITYPDSYAKPVLSKETPRAYTYSSLKKTPPSGVIAVIMHLTDGKLSPRP